jgi:hypothetical protein
MRIRSLSMTGGAMLALVLALPAGAQTSDGSAATGQDSMGQRNADQMTCADIATMDTAVVPGTLYFIAGYQQGRDSGMQEDSADVTGVTGTSATPGAADSTGSGSAATGTTGTGDTTAAGSTGTTGSTDSTGGATSESGTAGSTETAGTTGQGTTGQGSGGSASSDASGQAQLAAISGFFEIPVEQVMRVCAESPERSVSDVVREEGSSGTGSSN